MIVCKTRKFICVIVVFNDMAHSIVDIISREQNMDISQDYMSRSGIVAHNYRFDDSPEAKFIKTTNSDKVYFEDRKQAYLESSHLNNLDSKSQQQELVVKFAFQERPGHVKPFFVPEKDKNNSFGSIVGQRFNREVSIARPTYVVQEMKYQQQEQARTFLDTSGLVDENDKYDQRVLVFDANRQNRETNRLSSIIY